MAANGEGPSRTNLTWGGEARKALLSIVLLIPFFAAQATVSLRYGRWAGYLAGFAALFASVKLLDLYVQRRHRKSD